MKANVMIGNYFYRPDCVDRVVEIRKNGVIGSDNLRGLISWSEIKPIPLTKEILKKNGFSLNAWINFQWISADKRVILHNEDKYINTHNKWHVHVDTEDMRTIGSIELTYVHQFQQFLRLCGMNELANNFKV